MPPRLRVPCLAGCRARCRDSDFKATIPSYGIETWNPYSTRKVAWGGPLAEELHLEDCAGKLFGEDRQDMVDARC